MIGQNLITIGILVIIVGIFILFIGSALLSTGNDGDKNTEIKTGGVLMIGPIPIIFGNDRSSVIIGVILALILMVVSYILFYR